MTNGSVACPVCGTGLIVRLARGRKSGKPFVMLICPADGRHIRAFINDRDFVGKFITGLETRNIRDSRIDQSGNAGALQN